MHIIEESSFYDIAYEPKSYVSKLMNDFWPGAMTLVVNKKPDLPKWLGGHTSMFLNTVGIRMPANKTARDLIKSSKRILAAPSANVAGKPSPTKAEHVLSDFKDSQMDIPVIDGEEVSFGLESTVIDVTADLPCILRPGQITADDIIKSTGLQPVQGYVSADTPRSPGQKYKHYAPDAPLVLVSGDIENRVNYIKNSTNEKRTGVLIHSGSAEFYKDLPGNCIVIKAGETKNEIAQNLFHLLREFDKLKVEQIFAEDVSVDGYGEAIMDRLKKAAGGRIIHV